MSRIMRVTVTGATGFVGRTLVPQLQSDGHEVHILGRAPRKGLSPGLQFSIWDPEKGPPPLESLSGAGAVIHLAGEPVAQRWSPSVKERIRNSRVEGTNRLVEALARADSRPEVLVCASAVGYYGDRGDELLEEDATPGKGFLPDVCREWEKSARAAERLGMRVVMVRTGVVLGKGGGALSKMLPPFKAGVGGRLGSGKQWMPWIHIEDLARLIQFAVETASVKGPINGVAPNPVTNSDFTIALARALRRPAIFPVPLFAIRLLFGEMSEILTSSQRAVPKAALDAGFKFHHPEVYAALKDMV
jgi:uncharacterized protein (TIGR01777 family)